MRVGARVVGVVPICLHSQLDGRTLVLSARGNWASASASQIEPEVDAVLKKRPRVERVKI
jgi:hypothetical protein